MKRSISYSLILTFCLLGSLSQVLGVSTFTVTTNADNAGGTNPAVGAGTGTLRQAIVDANAAVNVGGNDIIQFNSNYTITLLADLPAITGAVTIDGYPAVGSTAPTPRVGINGFTHGFLINNAGAAGSIIRGFAIWSCSEDGIEINGVSNITITGCYIGLLLNGTIPGAPASNKVNDNGILLIGATNNIIGGATTAERNVIAACLDEGIHITASSTGNTISGNYIGVFPAGNTDAGNGQRGIRIASSNNNTIGGGTNRRNIISGNDNHGIYIDGSTGNVISSNYIGLGADGTTIVNNTVHGIILNNSSNTTIGGTTSAFRNVISGNGSSGSGSGISIEGASNSCIIAGNYLGISATGTVAKANVVHGINVTGSTGITIGGTVSGSGNVISGNTWSGINLVALSHNAIIKGNYVGTNAAGTAALANATNVNLPIQPAHGIYIDASNNCVIGGTNSGERNIISGNGNEAGENGISISNSNGYTIQGNFVGLTANGLTALANFDTGLSISTSTGNTIGGGNFMSRNVFSGNSNYGIFLNNVDNSTFTGNFIGTDSTGNIARGNGVHGIHSNSGSDANTWTNNVVSGNGQVGFDMLTSSNSFYYGNYVGLGYNGTTDLGNGTIGMRFGSTSNGNTIGSALSSHRNIIAGNNNHGVMFDAFSSNNIFKGNYIGSDATGKVAIGNTTVGVFIFQNANNNTIGGAAAGEGNLISSSTSGAGIQIQISDDTKIYGNIIGLDKDKVKTAGFGNFENGILIGVHSQPGFTVTANRTIIGGTAAGQANTISNNRLDGVSINYWDGTGNSNLNPIVGNSIYCNGGLGINHASNNVNENQGIAPPVISSRTANVISGTGNVGNTIHIYRNETADGGIWCNCEGETLIGTLTVPASGNWSLTHNLSLSTAQANAMTATATNATNSTSEFSSCANIPLPVEYIYFTAKVLDENSGLIEWATASEKNNSYFTVQRSYDGKNFTDLKIIEGNGTTNSINSYSFIDEEISSSVVYYRVKQVDFDGQISFSDVRSIVFSEESISVIHKDNQKVSIVSQLKNGGDLLYGVYTVTGQQLIQESYSAEKGVFEKNISMSGMAPGIYMIKIFSNNLIVSEKVNLK